jgi:RNA polymerase sigma-70 factor (ECF subfamily)
VNAHSTNAPGIRLEDEAVLNALRQGDEQVFVDLVKHWGSMMMRVAMARLGNRGLAEDVVQDAWLTMLRTLDRFERRSSLRTWVLGIVINLARARARAERREIGLTGEGDEPSVAPGRFLPGDHPRWPRHWAMEPRPWPTPEEAMLAAETRQVVLDAVAALPASQREVVVLRDLEGLSAVEVCNVLGLTDTHQRVLLHRARSRVRGALEDYFGAKEAK